MLKTVYRCLESPNNDIYESGLTTLESVISMFNDETKKLAKPICNLLNAKKKPKFEKKISAIIKLLRSRPKRILIHKE